MKDFLGGSSGSSQKRGYEDYGIGHYGLPSGKLSHSELERSTMLLMGKLTISMPIFNSYFDITRG